jgi:hypothetical protein
MMIMRFISSFLFSHPFTWLADWAWGTPLIVLTVVIHVAGLGVIKQKAFSVHSRTARRHHQTTASMVIIGAVTLSATFLHSAEALLWAGAYVCLSALPDWRTAMLYSLNAMTSYGHTNLGLVDRWHLMGAIEALNGWLLFGLTTAFLFAVIDRVWIPDTK